MGRKRKIDTKELVDLAQSTQDNGKPLTHEQMADALGVTRGAVTKALKKIPPSILATRNVETFRNARADIFAEAQRLALIYLMDPLKLKSASPQQLMTVIGILYDKERLEQGKATEHIAVAQVNKLDPESIKAIKEAIQKSTEQKLVEAAEHTKIS